MFKLRQEHATKRNAFCQQACIFSEQHCAKKNISGSDIYSGFVDLHIGPCASYVLEVDQDEQIIRKTCIDFTYPVCFLLIQIKDKETTMAFIF